MKYILIKSSLSILVFVSLSGQVGALTTMPSKDAVRLKAKLEVSDREYILKNKYVIREDQIVDFSNPTEFVPEDELAHFPKRNPVKFIEPEDLPLSVETSEETHVLCEKYIDHLNRQAETIIKKNKLDPESEKKVRQVLQDSIKNLILEMGKLKEERRIIIKKMSSGSVKEIRKSFIHIYKRDEGSRQKKEVIQAKVKH